MLIGIPSNGIHTNGYSLVRKVFKIEKNKLEIKELQNNKDLGALRIKSIGVKDNSCMDFPLYLNDDKEYNENVVLEIDYWVLIPKKK